MSAKAIGVARVHLQDMAGSVADFGRVRKAVRAVNPAVRTPLEVVDHVFTEPRRKSVVLVIRGVHREADIGEHHHPREKEHREADGGIELEEAV